MRGLAILTFCLGLLAQPALADGVDGRWNGAIPSSAGCDYESTVTLQTAGGALHGQVLTTRGNYAIAGDIDAAGKGVITVDNISHGTVHLADGRLVLDWANNFCRRHAELQPLAAAPGRFDGAWQADRLAMNKPCNASTYLRLVVVGTQAMGQLYAPWHNAYFTAEVGPDGSGKLEMEGSHGSIRIQGDRFQLAWVGGRCGNEVALGDRVPDESRVAAMRQARRTAQEQYLALKDAAEAGRKPDYTALRMASVQAPEWAFFNNKADGPMSQAALAAKGGDCEQALANLDQAIGYDFTMDTAHALKADCLRKKNPHAAKIEDAIANGLVHSLMTSGNGKSEKTAYVVTTGREMADVLANRHIEIRTRRDETRSSDGRFYAVIQGVTIGSKQNKLQTVYFNIDAFVVGRQSKRV